MATAPIPKRNKECSIKVRGVKWADKPGRGGNRVYKRYTEPAHINVESRVTGLMNNKSVLSGRLVDSHGRNHQRECLT